MRILSFRFLLFLIVCLDVVALPASCYANANVYCYFYLESEFTHPDPTSTDAYLILVHKQGELITAEDVTVPVKEGYVFLGWTQYGDNETIIDFDIIVSRTYYQGERNLMIFIAKWEEEVPE